MGSGIHVLCVDDDPSVCELEATVLERTDEGLDVTTAGSGREGLAVLDGSDIDCIVSDYDMPEMDGLEFLDVVRDRDPAIPFLLVTGTDPSEIAREAIEAGVTDYLQKRRGTVQYEILAHRIRQAVEKRRAERARAAADRRLERYRKLVENVADPMYLLDETGSIALVNDALVDRLGRDRDRLVGSNIERFVTDETFERATAALRESLESDPTTASSFESAFEVEDGGRKICETSVTPLLTDDGELDGSVGVVREITRRKERERELSQYETILETAPFGLFVLDADATIVWMNEEYASEFEEERDDLLGLEFPTLVERGYYQEAAIDRYIDDVRALLSSNNDRELATYNIQFRSAEGDERIYDVHTKLLPLEDGEFAGTVHALRDITQQQHYRDELERQNERLEEFASLVSHDLRNPLNVAQGHLDMLDEQVDSQHVDELRWSLSRMEELVDGLLRLARQGKTIGDREWVSLASVAREAWSTVDTGDARLEVDTDVRIYADEARIRELLENLCRNAVEHGSTGPESRTDSDPAGRDPVDAEGGETGALTVTIGAVDREQGSTGDPTRSRGFYVADSGLGLPDDRESLFEFGYTTSPEGTGFGLAIVEQIAEAHGWEVSAGESRDGGARFEIRGVSVDADETDLE
ncbi:PAS domain S-box protein [Natrinema salsiterrestre]|uniref:histidine kinase n=1 Tax=Natrinema salsiterrestre TaxID=2950540 RepID=A0A9Q4Q0Y7_9EURY|nr:PAS domain S-box protein [Natrinema salsiterrestre]MDF9744871.1 PAS domain S-box protein [Natrinema salsiterrestre]